LNNEGEIATLPLLNAVNGWCWASLTRLGQM